MYKAKIVRIEEKFTYIVSIPSLKLNEVSARIVGPKGVLPTYEIGDLVLVDQFNDNNWLVLGLIYT